MRLPDNLNAIFCKLKVRCNDIQTFMNALRDQQAVERILMLVEAKHGTERSKVLGFHTQYSPARLTLNRIHDPVNVVVCQKLPRLVLEENLPNTDDADKSPGTRIRERLAGAV